MISRIKLYHVASYGTMLSLPVALFLMFSLSCHATTTYRTDPVDKKTINNSHSLIVSIADTIRKNAIDIDNNYPGGIAALRLFIKESYKYPTETTANVTNGTIFIKVVVTKKGKIKDPKIILGINKAWDNEALRVVGLMPDWKPAIKKGNPVEVEYQFTIEFHQPDASSSTANNNAQMEVDIEQNTEFPEGYDAMQKFLNTNLQYPVEAQEYGTQGTVFVRFIVQSSGKITDIALVSGIGHGCDEEAIRVVKKMPNWNPARKNGIPVPVLFMIPIKFQLQIR